MRKSFIAIACILGLLYACRKDIEYIQPAPADTTLEKISQHDWTITRLDINGNNVFGLVIPACQQDDSYRFYKDSVMSQYENANVCVGNADSSQSHWQLYNGTKSIIATVFGTTDTANIELITDTELTISLDYNGNPAVIYFKK
ncbi:MAG: hypothetical protein RLZZ60_688 [Bacteroidota bacterium]|jgi:hypothetical protein